jgi:hypothetical protein
VAPARGDVPGSRPRRWERAGDDPAVRSRRVILYTVRKYLHISPDEWHALSWDIRETYLDGLAEDPEVPFSVIQSAPGPRAGAQAQGSPDFTYREVNSGAQVIDLRQMIGELEGNPEARKQQ